MCNKWIGTQVSDAQNISNKIWNKKKKCMLFKILKKILNLKLFIAHNYVTKIFLLYMLLVIFNFKYFFINQVFFSDHGNF